MWFRSAAVVCAALLALLTGAPGAQAAWRNGVCESNDFCVWKGTNHSGGMRDLPNAVLNWSQNDASFVNQDSSWHNRYFQPVKVYRSASYGGGTELCLGPGLLRTAGVISTWDDDGQSNHNVSSCSSSALARTVTEERLARACLTALGHVVQPVNPPLDRALEPAGLVVPQADPLGERAWEALPDARKSALTVAAFGTDGTRVSVRTADGGELSTNTDGCFSSVRAKLYGSLERYLLAQSNETP